MSSHVEFELRVERRGDPDPGVHPLQTQWVLAQIVELESQAESDAASEALRAVYEAPNRVCIERTVRFDDNGQWIPEIIERQLWPSL